jgi:REP element-mobilizing transposase RayT
VQLTLDQARKPTGRGGWRPGAGRPRGRKTVSHEARERIAAKFPVHVTLRVVEGVRLRKESVVEVVRASVGAACGDTFRVVEFNVLGNHLHMIVEAGGPVALARGMQGLCVRLARRINAKLGRRGALFSERYHARALRTPREVRDALRYVLLHARHHAAERGEKLYRGWVDPFSSAPWFEGWSAPIRTSAPWIKRLLKRERPTARARTWLLAEGWRKQHGPLEVDEVPG